MQSTPDRGGSKNNPEIRGHEGLIKATDVLAGAAGGATIGLLLNSVWSTGMRGRMPSMKSMGLAIGAAGLLGAAIGAGRSMLRGSGYQYETYDPKALARKAGDRPVVIYFSGAAGGDWMNNNPDVTYLDSRFGRGNYALFDKNSIEDATTFALGLPKGTKLRVMGHSMGGPAAYEFAELLGDMGVGVYRLDTIDPVGTRMGADRREGKPPNVGTWHNYIPENYKMSNGPTNVIALAGGPWGSVRGARNHVLSGENANHRLIRYEVPADPDMDLAEDNTSNDRKSTELALLSFD